MVHSLRRQYPPLSLSQLQLMIDTDCIDTKKPVDLVQICNTGLYEIKPQSKHYGVHLTDEVCTILLGELITTLKKNCFDFYCFLLGFG